MYHASTSYVSRFELETATQRDAPQSKLGAETRRLHRSENDELSTIKTVSNRSVFLFKKSNEAA